MKIFIQRGGITAFSRLLMALLVLLLTNSSPNAQVTIASTNTATGTTSTVNSLTGVPSGALLVLVTTAETHLTNNCAVSSSPSLTWTKRADAEASNSGDAEIWTAVTTSSGNITVTSDWANAGSQAAVCYVITGQESSLGGASATGTAQSAPSVNITTTRANSIIIGGVSDWWAVNGSSRSIRDGATETHYHRVANAFTTYGFYKPASGVATYTEGYSAPTGQGGGTVLYEIRTPSDTQAPSSFTLSSTGQTSSTIDLSWTAATDNVGVTGYEIYKDGVYVTTTSNLTYTLTGLNCNTQYSIYIKARDAANNSTNSNTITPATSSCSPTCVTIVNSNAATGTTNVVNSLTSVPAGALLVVVTSSETDQTNNCSVTSSPSLTWTKRVDAQATSSGDAEIWTAVYTTGGNINVTSDWANAINQAAVCYVITGQESSPGGASATGNSQSAPSVNITTTRANSIIIGGVSDWNAVNGSSKAYRNSVTEDQYRFVSGRFTSYIFHQQATTATSYTQGLSAPTGQSAGTVLYEVRCPAVPDTTAPTAPTVTITDVTASTITISMAGATDNVAVTGYDVYVNNVLYASNVSSPYIITGLAPSTLYNIYVKARDGAGNVSAASNTDSETTLSYSPYVIQGFGANATGGAGGTVYHVTNLNSSGAGSFSDALFSGSTPKIIVFDVSGVIYGNYTLENMSYITIDGNCQNVVLNGNNNGDVLSIRGGSHHIIVKDIHVTNGSDGINVINGAHDVAILNCSSYGNSDGNIDIADGGSGAPYNVTVQYCILGNGVGNWGGDMLITAEYVTAHHNLFIPTTANQPGERCPFVHANYVDPASPNADIRNNLVWKYGRNNGTGSGYGTGVAYDANANVVNNYYYTVGTSEDDAVMLSDYGSSGTEGNAYVAGNVSGNAGVNPNSVSNHAEWSIPGWAAVTMQEACAATDFVLDYAGPCARNAADLDYVNSVSITGCSGRMRNPVTVQPKTPGKPSVVTISGIYPNPARSLVNVNMHAMEQDNVTLVITDITGKFIKQQQANVSKGSNTIPVNIHSLVPGTYLLKLVCKSDCNTVISKLIKL